MKSSVQKGRKLGDVRKEDTAIDFITLASEVGYIKARQIIKQVTVKSHQQKIDKSDEQVMTDLRPARLKDAVKLSMTLGAPTSFESEIDKMMENVGSRRSKTPTPTADNAEELREIKAAADSAVTVRRSFLNQELTISQMDMDHLPLDMGTTLSLQLSHVKKLNCSRNNFTGLLSHKLPQLSSYNLRYMEYLGLAGNKMVRLCPDVSMMTHLREVNLAGNNIRDLPKALSELQQLTYLDLSDNNLSILSDDFGELKALEVLNLSSNQIFQLPTCFTKVKTLRRLDMSKNCLVHMAMLPRHMLDELTGRVVYVNILTRERTFDRAKYTGEGIQREKALHMYQEQGTVAYKKRRIWLSICKTYEWEPILDEESGSLYYRNNVSGDTQWEMPDLLDVLGCCEGLEYLSFNDNTIKSPAMSIANILTLKEFHCDNNRLHELPRAVGNLKKLEILSVKSNELDSIPESICECDALKRIEIKGNHVRRLPAEMGVMKSLETLNVTANTLRTLPFSLGFCKTLTTLLAVDNPLEDPPYDQIIKGLDGLMWYLRQRYHIEKQGMPPPMRFQTIGLKEEIVELYPEFKLRIRAAIERCKECNEMNLQLMGLREVPREVLKLPGILELRLDQNQNLAFPNGIPPELKSLKLLSVRNCCFTEIPLSISILAKLHTLELQENCLNEMPITISRLKRLGKLDLSKNRIYNLKPGLGMLEHLTYLNIDGNCISELPIDLSTCRSLKTLNCARNRLTVLPTEYCELFSMSRLNIENNRLLNLPPAIKNMRLEVLRVGYNSIEIFPADMFSSDLGRYLKKFSCQENNLLELPMSIKDVVNDIILEAEFNPLLSPPSQVLSEGFRIVQAYMRVRSARLKELTKLLTREDFVFEMSQAIPMACEVLQDGTGFLTPHDTDEFDLAVDEYVNGELYTCPASGKEIVNALVKLRDTRESQIYLEVLTATHKAITMCMEDPLYGNAVLGNAKRPWGKKGEMSHCYVISLHALLRDTPPNKKYQPEGRPSMMHLIEKCMPHTTFPFTVELLKDSLRLFLSPFGQVADTEVIKFESCDCIDERRRKPLYHDPCEKPAVVLLKIIYTEEEAERRDTEEYLFNERFEEIDSEIRLWLNTGEGIKMLNKQVSHKKASIAEELELREELRKVEMMKERQFTSQVDKLTVRLKQFQQGLDFDVHHILSENEGLNMRADAEKKMHKQKARVKQIEDTLVHLEVLRKMDRRGLKKMLSDDIVRKYCFLFYQQKVKELRKEAIRKKQRRPWDGEDGAEFEAMRNRLFAQAMAEGAKEGEEFDLDAIDALPEIKLSDLPDDREEEYKPEYDWADTDDMSKYSPCDVYDRYLKEHGGILGGLRTLFS